MDAHDSIVGAIPPKPAKAVPSWLPLPSLKQTAGQKSLHAGGLILIGKERTFLQAKQREAEQAVFEVFALAEF